MSTGPNTAKRRGRNSRTGPGQGAEQGAGRGSTAPLASQAASSSTAPATQCGWLGQLFGQCCKGDAVEPEVRVGSPEDEQRARRETAASTVASSRGSAGPSRAGHSEEPVGGKLGLQKPTETTGRYMIDNSILQIPNRPGVAYRYSKSETDKVKNEAGPAKWGDIVDGIDEGDGWLKVGQYYLPMTYRGIPVITAVQDSGAGQTKPKRRGEGTLSSAVSAPAPAPVPAPARAATTPPSSLAVPILASAPGGAAQGHEAKAPIANSAKECEDSAAAGGAGSPQNTERFIEHSAKDTTPKLLTPSGTSPVVFSQPSPSQPLQHEEQKQARHEANEQQQQQEQEQQQQQQQQLLQTQVKLDATRQQEEFELREATQPERSETWCLRPSVGTWLHRIVPKVHPVLESMPSREECSNTELWCHKPSVGTWLQRLPNQKRDQVRLRIVDSNAICENHKPNNHTEDRSCGKVAEEAEERVKQGTPKGEKLVSVSVDVDPFSPSTCAPESATCTPTAITGQSPPKVC